MVAAIGTHHVPIDRVSRCNWRGPAMRNNQSLFGVSLAPLPRLLYGSGNAGASGDSGNWGPLDGAPGLELALQTWRQLVDCNARGSGARQALKGVQQVFPRVPFVVTRQAPTCHIMVQFLIALSWSVGTLTLNRQRASLVLHDAQGKLIELGVSERAVVWAGGARSSVLGEEGHFEQRQSGAPGPTLVCLTQTASLFEHAVQVFPELTLPLTTLFSAAVHGGPSLERELTAPFVFMHPKRITPVQQDWLDAIFIVTRSARNPVAQLHRLLHAHTQGREFTQRFGNPSRANPSWYTPGQRQRHLEGIAWLRARTQPYGLAAQRVLNQVCNP